MDCFSFRRPHSKLRVRTYSGEVTNAALIIVSLYRYHVSLYSDVFRAMHYTEQRMKIMTRKGCRIPSRIAVHGNRYMIM